MTGASGPHEAQPCPPRDNPSAPYGVLRLSGQVVDTVIARDPMTKAIINTPACLGLENEASRVLPLTAPPGYPEDDEQ